MRVIVDTCECGHRRSFLPSEARHVTLVTVANVSMPGHPSEGWLVWLVDGDRSRPSWFARRDERGDKPLDADESVLLGADTLPEALGLCLLGLADHDGSEDQ